MADKFNEAEAVKVVFSNPTGEKLLNHWFDTYIRQPSFFITTDGPTSHDEVIFREGQRSFATYIYNLLNERQIT